MTLSVGRIESLRPNDALSGTLALQLWATDLPYQGVVSLVGYKLCEIEIERGVPLGRLRGGDYWLNVAVSGPFTEPPAGVYNMVLVLAEWSVTEFRIVDWFNFAERQSFGTLPPAITSQPASQTALVGDRVTFSVAVSGTPPFAFQWYHDTSPIPGANSSTLVIPSAQPSDSGSYWVHVINLGGAVDSGIATLKVEQAPIITQQPLSQVVGLGGTYTLSVVASGIPTPTYQWNRFGFAIEGATNATYGRTNVQPADGGTYSVTVRNSRGTVTSQFAVVQVNRPPTVNLTSPTNGAAFVEPATIVMAAAATDADSAISRVEFYQGTILLGTATAAPYTFTWSAVPPGAYTVTAKATDAHGATALSGQVAITVRPPSGCVAPPAGLALWWAGEGDGRDLAGLRTAAIDGGTTYAAGKVGQCFSFNEEGGSLRAAGVAPTAVDNWSMSAWYFWKGTVGTATKEKQTLLYNGHEGRHGYGLIIPEQGLCAVESGLCAEIGKVVVLYGGTAYIKTGVALDPNSWSHVVLVRENGVLKLYKNGLLAFSSATGNPVAPSAADGYTTVGGLPGTAMNGMVDEVMLFTTALTAGQVWTLFAADHFGACRPELDLGITAPGDGSLRLTVNGTEGRPITLFASQDLLTWLPVATVTNPAPSLTLSNAGSRFYKALLGASTAVGEMRLLTMRTGDAILRQWDPDTGEYLQNFAVLHDAGGWFASETDVASDGSHIYSLHVGDARVRKWSMDGNYLSDQTTLRDSRGHVTDQIGIATEGRFLYTIARGDPRVREFDMVTGEYRRDSATLHNLTGPVTDQTGIAIDGGHLYTVATGDPRIRRFDLSGAYVEEVTSLNDHGAPFLLNDGIAVFVGQ